MKRRGFILLEVLVAVVILAVAFTAIVRGLFVAMETMQHVRTNEQAMFLGRSMLHDLELEAPDEGHWNGKFADDPRYGDAFAGFTYDLRVDDMTPTYREKAKGKLRQDLETYKAVTLRISFAKNSAEPNLCIELRTNLLGVTLFSSSAIQSSQQF